MRIAALKGDLLISDGQDVVPLAQGQQTTRDESSTDTDQDKKKKKRRKPVAGAIPAASGGLLNSPVAVGIGGATVLGVGIWVLLLHDHPASPSQP